MRLVFPEVRLTAVRIVWQPPEQPNGIILGKRVDRAQLKDKQRLYDLSSCVRWKTPVCSSLAFSELRGGDPSTTVSIALGWLG